MYFNQLTILALLTIVPYGNATLSQVAEKLSKRYKEITDTLANDYSCIKNRISEIRSCTYEYKEFLDWIDVEEDDQRDYCCTIFRYQSCVERVVNKYCSDQVERIITKLSNRFRNILNDECDGSYSFFQCLDTMVLYGGIGGIILIAILILTSCCCCCCGCSSCCAGGRSQPAAPAGRK